MGQYKKRLVIELLLVFVVIVHCLSPGDASESGHEHRSKYSHRKLHKRRSFHNNTQQKRPRLYSSEQEKHVELAADEELNPVNVIEEGSFTNSFQSYPNDTQQVTVTENKERKFLDAEVFKSLLRDLLSKLDAYAENETFSSSSSSSSDSSEVRTKASSRHHCHLHGLWLSTVAGAAIELLPEKKHGHTEIHTEIFELPDNPYPPLITSQWTGKGIISQESPTTLTIVFQEHIEQGKQKARDKRTSDPSTAFSKAYSQISSFSLPRTAVFVGQCLVCHGSPMLQGSWVIFPPSQTCTGNGLPPLSKGFENDEPFRMNSQDMMYLLRQ